MIIALEGVNGVGKTTIARDVCAKLLESGHKVEYHKFPGTTGFRGEIRSLLSNYEGLSAHTQFHLYLADMAEFYSGLSKDTIYIVDRSFVSTLVYQQMAGISRDTILQCVTSMELWLDAVVLLTCDIETLCSSLQNREYKSLCGYGSKSKQFYDELQKSYMNEIRSMGIRNEVIDVSDRDKATGLVLATIERLMCDREI